MLIVLIMVFVIWPLPIQRPKINMRLRHRDDDAKNGDNNKHASLSRDELRRQATCTLLSMIEGLLGAGIAHGGEAMMMMLKNGQHDCGEGGAKHSGGILM